MKIRFNLKLLSIVLALMLIFSGGVFVGWYAWAPSMTSQNLYTYDWVKGYRPVSLEYGLPLDDLKLIDHFRRPLPRYTGDPAAYKIELANHLRQDMEETLPLLKDRFDMTGREFVIAYVTLRAANIYDTYSCELSNPGSLESIANGTRAECIKFSLAAMVMLDALGGFDTMPISFASPSIPGHTVLQIVDLKDGTSYLSDPNCGVFMRLKGGENKFFFEAIFDMKEKEELSDKDIAYFPLPSFIKYTLQMPDLQFLYIGSEVLNKRLLPKEEDYRKTFGEEWTATVKAWQNHFYAAPGLQRNRDSWFQEAGEYLSPLATKYELPNKIAAD